MLPNIHSTDTLTELIDLLDSSIPGVNWRSLYGPCRWTLSGYAGSHKDIVGSNCRQHAALIMGEAQIDEGWCYHAVSLRMDQKDWQSSHQAQQHFETSYHETSYTHCT